MFITVFTQVSVLMLMIAVGFIAAKTGIMTEAGAACCTDIALIIATPCVIIKSLMRRFDAAVMKSLLLAVALTLLVQVLMITLGTLLLRSKDLRRQRTLRFGSIFANCGFMPLRSSFSLS